MSKLKHLSFGLRHMCSSVTKQTSNVLVINCGSSTAKFQVLDPHTNKVVTNGLIDRIGTEGAVMKWKHADHKKKTVEKLGADLANHFGTAFENIARVTEGTEVMAVGHRVVHGGEKFSEATLVDDKVMDDIRSLCPLAPLHNPANLMGIEYMKGLFPSKKQVAVFDTSFHQSIPPHAYRYAIPDFCYDDHKVRKYGFHGTSHSYIIGQVEEKMGNSNLSVITAHLGNGCSVTASKAGQSLDTSMGFSPLEGLVMGHRSGDIDPIVVQYLCDVTGKSLGDVINMLNRESGLKGLSGGQSGDSRDVEDNLAKGCLKAKLAVDTFCYRLAKYIGAYATVPLKGRPDVIAFSGGIGEKSAIKRAGTIALLEDALGCRLDPARNEANGENSDGVISKTGTSPVLMVIPTNEELMIARETLRVCSNSN